MTIYFDHNATTRLHPDVRKAMQPYLDEEYGNASCLYSLGVQASYAIEKARLQTARLINAHEEEIVFTSGGTESDNQALQGIVLATGKKHIITSAIEHPAILNTCRFLERYLHCRVTYLPVDDGGFLDPSSVESSITADTALVSIMAANNEIGSLQAIPQIAQICRKRSVLFHTDAVQAAGRIPIDVNLWGVDLLSLSAHKMYGPKGIGCLFIRQNTPFVPFLHGGSQERGRRAGTENVPAIVGLGKAAALATCEMTQRMDRIHQRTASLWKQLSALELDIQRNSPQENCLPGTLNITIPGINAREWVRALADEGFCVATGSACSTGKTTPSYVLKALGKSDTHSLAAIRISLGWQNTEEEIAAFIQAIPRVLSQLGTANFSRSSGQ